MREIKFRGFTLLTKEWVYGVPVLHVNGAAYMLEHSVEGFSEAPILGEIDPRSLGQYTGLKDKNRKEIYEGDIVEVKDRRYELHGIGTVEWDKENGLWMIYFPDTQGATMLRDWLPKEYEASLSVEVIGNVYENPELLEEG